MDTQDKTVSWFESVRDKLDNIINQVPFQYAENQLSTAGTNVKQFCSEFMEEMLPESIMNSLKETSSSLEELLRTDGFKEEAMEGISDACSPSPMEVVEDDPTDSSLGKDCSDEKELCFEEARFRDTAFPFEISHVKAHPHDGEDSHHDDLSQYLSSSKPAKESELSEPINIPSEDLKVEVSTAHSSSAFVPAIENCRKDLSAVIQQITDIEDQFLKNQVSSPGHKVEFSTPCSPSSSHAKEEEVSNHDGTEISDLKEQLSAVQISDGLIVNIVPDEKLFLENQVSSLGHEDRSGDGKAEETKDIHGAEAAGMDTTENEMIWNSCIILDSSKCYCIPDIPGQNATFQGVVCESCLKLKSAKEWECKNATSSVDGAAESDQQSGKSGLPVLEGGSAPLVQDFSEPEWVIV